MEVSVTCFLVRALLRWFVSACVRLLFELLSVPLALLACLFRSGASAWLRCGCWLARFAVAGGFTRFVFALAAFSCGFSMFYSALFWLFLRCNRIYVSLFFVFCFFVAPSVFCVCCFSAVHVVSDSVSSVAFLCFSFLASCHCPLFGDCLYLFLRVFFILPTFLFDHVCVASVALPVCCVSFLLRLVPFWFGLFIRSSGFCLLVFLFCFFRAVFSTLIFCFL